MKVQAIKFADVEKQIGFVARDAGKLQDKIHAVGVAILKAWHDKDTGADNAARLLNLLQEASPYHRSAFAKWVAEFTPLLWNPEEKKWVDHKKENVLMGKMFIAARNTPFWKVSPAPQAKPFDMFSEIEKLLTKAQKHLEKPVDGDKVDVAVLKHLREALKVQKTDA